MYLYIGMDIASDMAVSMSLGGSFKRGLGLRPSGKWLFL